MQTKNELLVTNNSLNDIIGWLKKGYMVCLHNKETYKYYYSVPEIKDDIYIDTLLIYVNITKLPDLLLEDEWPWYILREGFVRYNSIHALPTNKNNIHHFVL